MKTVMIPILGVLALAGCAGKGPTARAAAAEQHVKDAPVAPEAQIASVVEAFQSSSRAFAAQRKKIVVARQKNLDDTQRETALLAQDTAHDLAVWSLSQQSDKLQLYQSILTQANAAADSYAKFEKLLADQQQAIDGADTKVKINQGHLDAARKGLITLATSKSLKDEVMFYYDYATQTKDAIDKLKKNVDAAASKAAKPKK